MKPVIQVHTMIQSMLTSAYTRNYLALRNYKNSKQHQAPQSGPARYAISKRDIHGNHEDTGS